MGRNYTIPVDVTYQIDLWGSIRRGVAANSALAQASAAELENVRLLYQVELAADYFQIQGVTRRSDSWTPPSNRTSDMFN